MKIVINRCFGGFGLSMKARKRLGELLGHNDITFYKQTKYKHNGKLKEYEKITDLSQDVFMSYASKHDLGTTTNDEILWKNYFDPIVERHSPELIQTIEELGDEADGNCACLSIL